MLDLGANLECDKNNLVQFALMGQAFAKIVIGLNSPKVALLNVGEEEIKGLYYFKEASILLDQVIRVFEMPDSPLLQERFGTNER